MANLTQASKELFSREPDERCESLQDLWQRCQTKKNSSHDRWEPPDKIRTVNEERLVNDGGNLRFIAGNDGYWLNDWSFSQLCRMAGVAKDTVNRLSPDTANRVFQETLPRGGKKPLQLFIEDDTVRSIHGTQYTRLWDVDLINVVREFAVDFQPPQKGFNGATGLYLGEQDMFCFLIDPNGWTEINGEAFAPGFFLWNSEVGRRSLGISTFWFQAVCANHIVWDATEVTDFSRKHTANVHDGLREIKRIIEGLVEKRDARKDGFAKVIQKAMGEVLGADQEEVLKLLQKQGIGRAVAKKATELAAEQGRLTIFSIVDALTRMAREHSNAGDRIDADQAAASLLELVNA